MKKSVILGILGLTMGAVSSYGQGTINFFNYTGTTSPTVNYAATGVPAGKANLSLGGSFAAEVAWGVGTISDPNLLTLVPASITYFGYDGPGSNADPDGTPGPAGNGTGWYFGPTVTLNPGNNSAPAGTVVTLEVFAFNGNSIGAATVLGHSSLFQVTVGGGVLAAPNMVGTPGGSFTVASVAPVPEPTTLALAGLGGLASLVMLRRKKA